jgi:hypothetical protein
MLVKATCGFPGELCSASGVCSLVSDRFVSDSPALGTKRNDFILSTGLNFTFVH